MNAALLCQIRVLDSDADGDGVVFHARFLNYLEQGRVEWFRSTGVLDSLTRDRLVLSVRTISIEYVYPARPHDLVVIETKVAAVHRAHVQFQQRVLRDEMLLATAVIRLAMVAAGTAIACEFPEESYQHLLAASMRA